MKKAFASLIKVKSIVTIMLAAAFCILTLRGDVGENSFVTIFTTVIAFYFGTQSTK